MILKESLTKEEENNYSPGTYTVEQAFEAKNLSVAVIELRNYFSDNKYKQQEVLDIYFNEEIKASGRILKLENLYYPTLKVEKNAEEQAMKVKEILN